MEIFTPPYLLSENSTLAIRPEIVECPSTFSLGSNLTVRVDTEQNHTFALMRYGVATHAVNLDQRRVPLTVLGTENMTYVLQVPSNGRIVPPGLYWLFAMNEQGVPSVGANLMRTFP